MQDFGSHLKVRGTDAVRGGVTFLDKSRHIYKLTPLQPPVLPERADSGKRGAAVSKASSALQSKTGTVIGNQTDRLFTSDLRYSQILLPTAIKDSATIKQYETGRIPGSGLVGGDVDGPATDRCAAQSVQCVFRVCDPLLYCEM